MICEAKQSEYHTSELGVDTASLRFSSNINSGMGLSLKQGGVRIQRAIELTLCRSAHLRLLTIHRCRHSSSGEAKAKRRACAACLK